MNKKIQRNKMLMIGGIIGVALVLGLLIYSYYKIDKLNDTIVSLTTQVNGDIEETNAKIDACIDDITVYLPETIYVASGITTELYDSQITSLGEQIDNYNVAWVCNIGRNMERKFSVTGTDELMGEYPLEFDVYDNKMNLVASASTVISIVEDSLSYNISILTIGDSLSSNVNTYLHLAQLGKGNIAFVGTRDVDGYKCEARLGFTADDYLTKTQFMYEEGEPVQPFYNEDSQQFDWNYYKETTGCNPDIIEIFLGTNGADVDPTENGNNILKIIDLIRKDDPEIPIYMVNTIYTANQDGIGSWKNSHDVTLLPGRYKFEEDTKIFNLMVYLADNLVDYDKVYLVPAAITHDSAYNFNTNTETESPYTTTTQEIPDNGIHPGAAGYNQIADTIFSTLCGTMSNW
ncbi:MAG: SGNH/GDSL hydrolase family protein [Velocimicrobium sp.]